MRATRSRSSRTHTTTAITTPLEPPCCLSATVPQWEGGGGRAHGGRDGGANDGGGRLVGQWREDRGGRELWKGKRGINHGGGGEKKVEGLILKGQ